MKKRTKIIIGICALVILGISLPLMFAVYRSDSGFDGSKVCDSDEYLLDFSYMNRHDEHTLRMQAGDILKVTYDIEKGGIDVTIGISGHDPIYRGNEIETSRFELPIRETGDYIISVNSEKAGGRLEFAAEKQN